MDNALIRWVRGNKKKLGQPHSRENNQDPKCEDALKLVEGIFSPAEAADVLLSLINDKIKFHTVQALNLKEGYHEDVSRSEQRIKELMEAKSIVKDLVVKAQKEGMKIEIHSAINIRLKKLR